MTGTLSILCKDSFMTNKNCTYVKALGQGSFGVVEEWLFGAEEVAIKKFESLSVDCLREIVHLKVLSTSQKVVPIHEVQFFHESTEESNFQVAMVMPKFNDTLITFACELTKEQREKSYWVVYHQLLMAVSDVHDLDLIHRDIKPNNVLVKNDPNAGTDEIELFLADFGACRTLLENDTNDGWLLSENVYTDGFKPPEIYYNTNVPNYNKKADVYALGITLLFYLTLDYPENPFKTNQDFQDFLKPHAIPSEMVESLRELCDVDPKNRVSLNKKLKKIPIAPSRNHAKRFDWSMNHPLITLTHYYNMMSWIVDALKNTDAIVVCIDTIDRYLNQSWNLTPKDFRLVCISSVLISSQLLMVYSLISTDLSTNKEEDELINNAIRAVLDALSWRISLPFEVWPLNLCSNKMLRKLFKHLLKRKQLIASYSYDELYQIAMQINQRK